MCTGISMISNEGTAFLGRTQDFNILLNHYGAMQLPRGCDIKQAIRPFNIMYSILGLSFQHQGAPFYSIPDGVNEFGLSGSTQRLTDYAVYSTVEEIEQAEKFPVKSGQFLLWILGNCKDTYEIEEKLTQIGIVDLTIDDRVPGEPRHFLFTDRSGRTIVVEPDKKLGFSVHENLVKAMTNSPDFKWHLTNLSNYTNLSCVDPSPKNINGFQVEVTGKGMGMSGLPGDYSSASRFIRAAYMVNTSEVFDDEQTLTQMFHLLDNVSIPKGSIRLPEESENHQLLFTHYSICYNLKQSELNVRFYHNQRIQRVTFSEEIAKGTEIKMYKLRQEEDIQLVKD